MKNINNKIILSLSVMIACALFMACGNDGENPPTPEEITTEALANNWVVASGNRSVVYQNLDASQFWSDFKLEFTSDRTFITTGVPSGYNDVWPASGSFTFPDSENNMLIERNDGVLVTIRSISETRVELVFIVNEEGGRAAGTTGSYYFALSPGS